MVIPSIKCANSLNTYLHSYLMMCYNTKTFYQRQRARNENILNRFLNKLCSIRDKPVMRDKLMALLNLSVFWLSKPQNIAQKIFWQYCFSCYVSEKCLNIYFLIQKWSRLLVFLCWFSHPLKKIFICFNESPLKMMKNAFYLLLKALLVLKILNIFPGVFGDIEKTAWLEIKC